MPFAIAIRRARVRACADGRTTGRNAEAGLHFVEDEQGAVSVAGAARGEEKFVTQDIDAAFALHGFEDHRGVSSETACSIASASG